MNSAATQTGGSEMVSQPDELAPVKEMVRACIQCGTCTGSCPNAFAMDYTPRHLWRMVLMGLKEEIFISTAEPSLCVRTVIIAPCAVRGGCR